MLTFPFHGKEDDEVEVLKEAQLVSNQNSCESRLNYKGLHICSVHHKYFWSILLVPYMIAFFCMHCCHCQIHLHAHAYTHTLHMHITSCAHFTLLSLFTTWSRTLLCTTNLQRIDLSKSSVALVILGTQIQKQSVNSKQTPTFIHKQHVHCRVGTCSNFWVLWLITHFERNNVKAISDTLASSLKSIAPEMADTATLFHDFHKVQTQNFFKT